jgi:hypothetical protein
MTFYGCDPYEDRELYRTLFELTRITGNATYQTEADKAINWWFENTQGPSGLYPWGEHLGWDFQYEQPTYLMGHPNISTTPNITKSKTLSHFWITS